MSGQDAPMPTVGEVLAGTASPSLEPPGGERRQPTPELVEALTQLVRRLVPPTPNLDRDAATVEARQLIERFVGWVYWCRQTDGAPPWVPVVALRHPDGHLEECYPLASLASPENLDAFFGVDREAAMDELAAVECVSASLRERLGK